jgi:hypothetical protein
MFHAMLVKIRKIAATSTPGLPGIMPIKKRTAAGKNPSIGTDWRMSRKGSMSFLAFLFVAAT